MKRKQLNPDRYDTIIGRVITDNTPHDQSKLARFMVSAVAIEGNN